MILLKNKKKAWYSPHHHIITCSCATQGSKMHPNLMSAPQQMLSANAQQTAWFRSGLKDSTTQRLSAKPCLQHANHQGLRAKENETRFAGFPVTLDLSSRKRPK